MFLKLTELTHQDEPNPPTESILFLNSDTIKFMRRGTFFGHEHTQIYIGLPRWPHVKETPEEIMAMVGQ